jgi:hypothetical protein
VALRGFWLFIAGFLLAWGAHALWGWLPDQKAWVLTGLTLGLAPLAAFALSISRGSKWVWIMDRRLGLQEQASTAWELIQNGESGELSEALIRDVREIVPQVRQRMLKNGWFLERDLVSTLIVLLLLGMVYITTLFKSYSDLAGSPLATAPAIQQLANQTVPTPTPDSSGGQQQPGSQPGQQQSSQGSPGGDQPGQMGSGGQQPGSSNADPNALSQALQGMGSDLSQQAPTYDLGQSLQQLDLNQAAGDLNNLADQLKNLSPEMKDQLAQALQKGAEGAQSAGDPSLAQDLQSSADALQGDVQADPNQTGQDAGKSLDQLAQDLRDRAQQMQNAQAGSGTGGGGSSGQTGQAEPAERLQGENGNFELPLDQSSNSGLLSPAPADAAGKGTASGSLDSTSSSGQQVGQSPLIPNSFLWKWRDVVKSYFQH